MDLSAPVDELELMDSALVSDQEMRRALAFIGWSNRRFGGFAPVFDYLESWSRSWASGATLRLLDVGTGGAELPVALSRWGRERGFDLRVTAIDPIAGIAAVARDNAAAHAAIEVLQTDLFALAAGPRRFDFTLGSLLLHHIPPSRRREALLAADRLSSRGMIFVDLRRCRAAYWGARALTGFFGDRITRHDGPLSVRKGFSARELDDLARGAGLPYLRAAAHPFFRLSLAGRKERPGG